MSWCHLILTTTNHPMTLFSKRGRLLISNAEQMDTLPLLLAGSVTKNFQLKMQKLEILLKPKIQKQEWYATVCIGPLSAFTLTLSKLLSFYLIYFLGNLFYYRTYYPFSYLVESYNGPILSIPRVTPDDLGAYLCIAKNGVQPSMSKRVVVYVQCNSFSYILKRIIIHCEVDFITDNEIYFATQS